MVLAHAAHDRPPFLQSLAFGGFAGLVGASVVFPMDLVKTRLQAHRGPQADNVIQAFTGLARREGVRGLYRGLVPCLMGVVPEKAIKLAVNDELRRRVADASGGKLPVWGEALAGAGAGACQVVVTCPAELVKILMQTASMTRARASPLATLQTLGLRGIYRGARATLLRDVAFSAMYFPSYNAVKTRLNTESGLAASLAAGTLCGGTVAFLCTPLDVIKTRLQLGAKEALLEGGGREPPPTPSLTSTATRIFREEGFRALFRGAVPRVLIIAPLFGVSLSCYELQHRFMASRAAATEASAS